MKNLLLILVIIFSLVYCSEIPSMRLFKGEYDAKKRQTTDVNICAQNPPPCGATNTCCQYNDGALEPLCCPGVNSCCCADKNHCCGHPFRCSCKGTSAQDADCAFCLPPVGTNQGCTSTISL